MNGHIKFFKESEGWGMIEAADKRGDVFFHVSHLSEDGTPREGMAVEYSLNPDYPKRRTLPGSLKLLGKLAYVPIDAPRKAVAHGD